MSKIISRHTPPKISSADANLGIIYPAEVAEGFQNDHKVFMEVKKLHLEFSKLAYEYLGEDYKTNKKQEVKYENDVYNKGIPIRYQYTVDWGTPDWSSLGDPENKKDAVDAFIQFFRYEVGIQDYVIAGMMGCLEHESDFKSHVVNKSEKHGTGDQARYSSAVGPKYGAGLWANTGDNKFECEKAIGGYAWEAQPMSTQMQVTFSTSDGFKSLVEVIQNYVPWREDIREIIQKRLSALKEITPEQETGKNQYWDETKDISELEEMAVNQACDIWSLCAEHGTYTIQYYYSRRHLMPGPGAFRPIIAKEDPNHQRKRRYSAVQYYKYMKHLVNFDEHDWNNPYSSHRKRKLG